MYFPIFNDSQSPYALHNASEDELRWILSRDPRLERITTLVRAGNTPSKVRLGATCLGGPYKRLSPKEDHGRCSGLHRANICSGLSDLGYRNTEHVDWAARNGIVLIDIDNLVHDPKSVQFLLSYCALAVVIAWISARGHGLKIGVAVDPTPMNAQENYDAWAAAYCYVTGILSQSGIHVDEQYRVDNTPAVAQVAILAHDTSPIVRFPKERVPWAHGDRSRAPKPPHRYNGTSGLSYGADDFSALNPALASSPQELIQQLPSVVGYRSSSMFEFGGRCAQNGYDLAESKNVAGRWAHSTGMVEEYRIEMCMRHFFRGYESMQDNLLTLFPVQA